MLSPLDSLATELLEASVMELLSAKESVSDTASSAELDLALEELVTELLEASATESLLEVARCPTSLCTSLCRARTGGSPSQRLSDPLSLLLLTTPAPPMVSAPTG